jgi:hypothetical protein
MNYEMRQQPKMNYYCSTRRELVPIVVISDGSGWKLISQSRVQ